MAAQNSDSAAKRKRGSGRPFAPGHSGNPRGRERGVANKATTDARAAIAKFVDGNAHQLQEWLDKIGETDPERAFALFMSVVEYHVPKLGRTELTGRDGKDLPTEVHHHIYAGPRART